MSDTVLVTGASGFVGAAVARAAVARGFKVKVLMRQTANPANIAGLDVEAVTGDMRDEASMTRALVSIFTPPNVNVMPHVTAYASNGGSSIGFAQLDFGMASPTVLRPSFALGSNGGSGRVAALNSRMVASARTGSTSSSLPTSSSSVSARTLVTRRKRYSPRRNGCPRCAQEQQLRPAVRPPQPRASHPRRPARSPAQTGSRPLSATLPRPRPRPPQPVHGWAPDC